MAVGTCPRISLPGSPMALVLSAVLWVALPGAPASGQGAGSIGICSCRNGTNFRCDSGYVCADASDGGSSTARERGAAFGRRIREALGRLFSGTGEQRRQEEERDRRMEATYGPWVAKLLDDAARDRRAADAQIDFEYKAQASRLAQAGRSYRPMNDWNNAGFDAYGRKEWGKSLRYFRRARRYAPNDPTLAHNVSRARDKVGAQAKAYLASVKTSLEVVSLSRHLLIFHPDPYARAEAQKRLARETMEKIAETTAQFIVDEHLNRGKLEPFRWQSAADKAALRAEAERHSRYVARLVVLSFAETREALADSRRAGSWKSADIRVRPGTALSRLLEVSFNGFD